MNGKTSKLIKKIASERGNTTPKHIRALKRDWYQLTTAQRTQRRKDYQNEITQ